MKQNQAKPFEPNKIGKNKNKQQITNKQTKQKQIKSTVPMWDTLVL